MREMDIGSVEETAEFEEVSVFWNDRGILTFPFPSQRSVPLSRPQEVTRV